MGTFEILNSESRKMVIMPHEIACLHRGPSSYFPWSEYILHANIDGRLRCDSYQHRIQSLEYREDREFHYRLIECSTYSLAHQHISKITKLDKEPSSEPYCITYENSSRGLQFTGFKFHPMGFAIVEAYYDQKLLGTDKVKKLEVFDRHFVIYHSADNQRFAIMSGEYLKNPECRDPWFVLL